MGHDEIDPRYLEARVAQAEEELKRENGGTLPPRPRSILEQIEELIQQQKQASLASESQLSAAPQKRYLTKKQVADFKGMTKQVDQISALVSICQQEFQLQPNFVFE